MTLRPIALTLLAVAVAACVSDQRPIPRDAPPPYRPGTYRTQAPPPQPQPIPPPPVQNRPPVYDQSTPVRQGDVILEVRGMTCPIKCTRQVKEMLLAAPGVQDVRIDYDAKAAIVRVAPGTDPARLPRYVRPPYSAHVVSAIAMGTR